MSDLNQAPINYFAIEDTDTSLQSKAQGNFGLNKATFSKIEYIENAGKGGEYGVAVDINLLVNDREYRRRIFDSTGQAMLNSKNVRVNPGEEGYQALFIARVTQDIAVIKHALKAAGVADEAIKALSAQGAGKTIAEGMRALVALLPEGYKSKQVDVFLEYQWEMGNDASQTYVEIPKNMKGGLFLVPHVVPNGAWNEVREEDGSLKYIDNSGAEHPFKRNADYMQSNKAIQQGGNSSTQPNTSKAISALNGQAKSTGW